MQRGFIVALGVWLLATGAGTAAETPALTARQRQRAAVEEILNRPVDWTPADDKPVTIDDLIAHLRRKHKLAVRWDVNALQVLGGEAGMSLGFTRAASHPAVINWSDRQPSPAITQYNPNPSVRLMEHVTYFPVASPAEAPKSLPPSAPVPVSPPGSIPPAGAVPPPIAPGPGIGAPPAPQAIPTPIPAALSPEALLELSKQVLPVPEPPPPMQPAGTDSEETPDPAALIQQLSSRPIALSAVALENATIADALHQLLDAAMPPINGMTEDVGLPLVIRAMTLDFVIEGNAVVITTRLRANALKETRVYRISHLKQLPPEAVAKAICHSVRPWSWRSQATEIADRFAARWPAGKIPTPAISVASVMTDGAVTPASAPSPGSPSTTSEMQTEDLKALGQLLSGGAITAFETLVNTLEIVHHGDPPTAVMEVLPGVLVITQSQGAHREIAELLEELAATAAETPARR